MSLTVTFEKSDVLDIIGDLVELLTTPVEDRDEFYLEDIDNIVDILPELLPLLSD